VILSPLPRYMDAPCCSLEHHMVNMKQEDHAKNMEAEVYKMRKNLKDFAFRAGRRNATTVSTWGIVKRLVNVWAGPVYLQENGYFAISEAVVEAVAGLSGKRKPGAASAPDPKKLRREAEDRKERTPASSAPPNRGGSRGGRGQMPVFRGPQQHRGGGWAVMDRGWSHGRYQRRGAARGFFY
jgi:hypothetical protein